MRSCDVPYALLIGVVSGALNFIPYAGALIAFVPAVMLAFDDCTARSTRVIVAVLIFVIHQIDGNFVAPRVLKDNVGLSPFWIVIAILGRQRAVRFAGHVPGRAGRRDDPRAARCICCRGPVSPRSRRAGAYGGAAGADAAAGGDGRTQGA